MLIEPANLPSSPACLRNREPILQALLEHVVATDGSPRRVLEVGSGTGQHAWFLTQRFAELANGRSPDLNFNSGAVAAGAGSFESLQHLLWQCSDVAANIPVIEAWRDASNNANFLPALELDLAKRNWPAASYDFIFTANTLHIVSWSLVLAFCDCAIATLNSGGKLFIYGPFNYNKKFTSGSNAAFDASLRARDALSGIRDFEAVCAALNRAAAAAGCAIRLCEDIDMPANNRFLVFEKQ
ncbi:MAG: DUF938 domain-containing protein [Pseudomonadales bacterium]|nr:DUF938 domain-containing protein [Pseudomonadales bacterium]